MNGLAIRFRTCQRRQIALQRLFSADAGRFYAVIVAISIARMNSQIGSYINWQYESVMGLGNVDWRLALHTEHSMRCTLLPLLIPEFGQDLFNVVESDMITDHSRNRDPLFEMLDCLYIAAHKAGTPKYGHMEIGPPVQTSGLRHRCRISGQSALSHAISGQN